MVDRQIGLGALWGFATFCVIATILDQAWVFAIIGGIFYLIGTHGMLRAWMELQDVLRLGDSPLEPSGDALDDNDSLLVGD